jgi:cytoskeletal protein CcmA (bactofilin family)
MLARVLPETQRDASRIRAKNHRPAPVVIDADLVMKGELRLSEEADLIILGFVDGASIRGVRNLSIGKHGRVRGDVQSVTAEIAGTLDGCLKVTDTALVKRTAQLHGEVSAQWVTIENGADLAGSVLTGNIRCADDVS